MLRTRSEIQYVRDWLNEDAFRRARDKIKLGRFDNSYNTLFVKVDKTFIF